MRKDKQTVHAMRHGILSQSPLQALARLGENTRRLRTIERKLRKELKPSGIAADILFDRMWSSYLRCLSVARAEELILAPKQRPADGLTQTLDLVDRELPTLLVGSPESPDGLVSPDLFRQLLLVQRYDAHFGREFLRCLSWLVIMKDGGEARLEQCVEKMLGAASR